MTPDERELRRALDARSGETSPEFRARLGGVLRQGKPSSSPAPAIAVVAVIALSAASVGILLIARGAGPESHPGLASGARLASPSPTPIALPTTAELSAPSSNVVWAFVDDSMLFRSTDGGDTWEQRSLPPTQGPRPEISFVDGQEGWYSTGGVPETQCNAAGTAIWHTTDGGANWSQVALVTWPQQAGVSGIGLGQCKEGLSFVDSKHGFLAAWDDNHRPTIYRTSDGGRTWKGAILPDPPGFVTQTGGFALRAGLARAFGATLLVPAWSMQDGAQSEIQYVFRSTDGGATWTYLAKTGNGINTVSFVTVSRWLQLIVPGQSIETTDSGKTWHPYSSDYSQAAPVAPQIVFGDSLVGYATVRGGIQRTADGGLHWTSIKTPGT